MAGAPFGNKNATKNRPISEAIRRAIVQKDGVRLRALAESLITIATTGEKDSDRVSAIKEISDRVEGRASQTILGPGEDGSHKLELIHQVK